MGRVPAAIVLARCNAWDEALEIVTTLARSQPEGFSLPRELLFAREVRSRSAAAGDLEDALARARAAGILLDRQGALDALAPVAPTIRATREGALFLGRVAWAAGADDEARAAARRKLGSPLRLREQSRDAWTFATLHTFVQDVRHALRLMWRGYARLGLERVGRLVEG